MYVNMLVLSCRTLFRPQLSRSLKRSAKTSVVAVLDYNGVDELFHKLAAEAKVLCSIYYLV